MKYFDPKKNWPRIRPHLKAAEPVLVRDFNKFTWGRWRQKFTAGKTPHEFESCDWWCDHRGRMPAYWQYVKHSACHWLVNHNLELAKLTLPKEPWRIITSELHSTVYNGRGLLFDLNYHALGVSATEAYQRARKHGEELALGEHLVVHYAEHWKHEVENRKMKQQQQVTITDAEIDQQMELASKVMGQVWKQKKVDPVGTAYSLWIDCTRTLAEFGWTEKELKRDLSWHVRDQIKESA